MPIDVVAALEASSRFPHLTSAPADLRGVTLAYDTEKREPATSGVNQDVVALAQRFGMLMAEYNLAIGDGKIPATRPSGCSARPSPSSRCCWR